MTADRETGARLLRQLRERRGWSWSDLARRLRDLAGQLQLTSLKDRQLPSIQRAVARWESPTGQTGPAARYQFLLGYLYARTAAGVWSTGPGSDFATLLDALTHFGVSPQRLGELAEMVSRSPEIQDSVPLELLAAGTADIRSAAWSEPGLVRRLQESVGTLSRRVGSVPFVRLQVELAPVVALCRHILSSDQTSPDDRVLRLAADAYTLAARLAFETRDDESAMQLYVEATAAAGRLADRSLRAAIQTSHAMVALHATDDPEAARQIARAATVDAHDGASYAVRARAHAVHAEICARAGQGRDAASALERAWKTIDQLSIDDPHGGFTANRLSGFTGVCDLHAGDAAAAHRQLDRSLCALVKPSDAVQRGIVMSDLALARLRVDGPAACAELLHPAVDIAAATGGRVAAQRIRLARRNLRPWKGERVLAELDEHIHEMLVGR